MSYTIVQMDKKVWRMCPGGILQISSDRDDRRIFWEWKFYISGYLVEKFWQLFVLVAWFKQDFFGYSKLFFLSLFRVISFNNPLDFFSGIIQQY